MYIIFEASDEDYPRTFNTYCPPGVQRRSIFQKHPYPYPVYFAVWVGEIPCLLPLLWFYRRILSENMRRQIPVFAFDSIISHFCACFRANFIIYRNFFPVNRHKIEESSPHSLHIPPSSYWKSPGFCQKHRSQGIRAYPKQKRRSEKNKKLAEWRNIFILSALSKFLKSNFLSGLSVYLPINAMPNW